MSSSTILVAGAAGFIGSTFVDRLLDDGRDVVGFDCFEPFYSRQAKERNVSAARRSKSFRFVELDTRDRTALERLVSDVRPGCIVDLAARAGVRDSLVDPWLYIDINVNGLQNLLASARKVEATYVFASSSSVYGAGATTPFEEDDMPGRPESPYGATKIAGEALVHAHHAVTGLPTRIARLFTVYGPRQRPDLAVLKFAILMLRGGAVPLYAAGKATRDYTFVADIVDGLSRMAAAGQPDLVVNLGSHQPYTNLQLVRALEATFSVQANIEMLPAQTGDVPATFAAIDRARDHLGWHPTTSLEDGLAAFRAWLLGEGASYLDDGMTV